MTPEEETAVLGELVDEVVRLLPGDWERARLDYRAVGRHEALQLSGSASGGGHAGIARAGRGLPASGVPERLRRLREASYNPDFGAWTAATFHLWKESGEVGWNVSSREPDDFPWQDEPTPADAAAELARFPRPDEQIPGWLRSLFDLHQAAEAFDPQTTPQRESDLVRLLPTGAEQLFMRARMKLADLTPGPDRHSTGSDHRSTGPDQRNTGPDHRSTGPDRLRVGTPADGCWTIAHTDGAWLALGPDGTIAPFHEARAAVVHAMAGVMADARMEINSQVLRTARLLDRRTRPRDGVDAWLLASGDRSAQARTSDSPRPSAPGPYIALDPLHNRPGGHFVCVPGPPPETGAFISVHDVYRTLADKLLPKPKPTAQAQEPPSEVLRPGAMVDAYGDPSSSFVYDVGTPFSRRGLWGEPQDYPYRVYRVEKPLRGYTGLFSMAPIFPTGETPPPSDEGMGYYLVDSIADLVASGHLVETTGPGNTLTGQEGQR
ncbi:TNT domain-containing protein [Actinomadura rubrisoli]|uniref:DUF4237 domain-containing protein n=1 Tax=Actinomadura rubrisoli TaxID=2530368 RepID=A0A4R5A0S2_9ACTN|nr:TNT domain-containing protein [Actinomadura rubrisoli]TDD64480.1 DUF4237 domain-containing protein [Actinomadura rubrisoli]